MASSSSSSGGFSSGSANSWVVAQRVRHASHAGSWYSDGAKELDRQLGEWLERVGPPQGAARAIISPHAGYSYCGETGRLRLQTSGPRPSRIFVLGPSHIVFLNGCALTTCAKYRTPLRDLVVDVQPMSVRNEEAEHSLEMQMPFVAKLMGDRHFTIVPVLVGSLSVQRQQAYGKIFAHYLADPQNLFVISSDFCHWGSRFHYQPHSATSAKPIHEQIALLDQRASPSSSLLAMEAIAAMDPPIFNEYLKETQNTICGRNPICVMLQAAEFFRQMNNHTAELRFLKYSQSNKCRNVHESSVSYAAGALFVQPK
ncbi:MEMO1 family protein [Aphelenchoides fujianensis]|nr:MEMO1 family protein [Aphelenchoides fujianensis]